VFLELDPNDFKKILPLYLRERMVFPLILAVIQRKQRGWVFVDNPIQPTSVIVMNNFGFMQSIGTKGFNDNFNEFFKSPRPPIPSYLLWYSPHPKIQTTLDSFTSGQVRRRERAHFILKKTFVENPVLYPAGFVIRHLNKELLDNKLSLKLGISSRFWASKDDFIKNGIGICVMKDDEIISLCYSACVVDGLAEIDVISHENYRGMGYATLAVQSFISECVRQGVTPTWDCFVSNAASMNLATKTGFEQEQTYFFYSFNIPFDISDKGEKDH